MTIDEIHNLSTRAVRQARTGTAGVHPCESASLDMARTWIRLALEAEQFNKQPVSS
jgi:hypothetical protein